MPRKTSAPRARSLACAWYAPGRSLGSLAITLTLSLMLGLGGCAIDPAKDAERVLADVPSAQLSEARALEDGGEPAKAAEAYLKMAETASSPAKE